MDWILRTLLYLPPQGSTVAHGVDMLHLSVIGVTMVASFGVGIAAFWFNVRYRRRSENQITPHVAPSLRREVTMICGLLTLFLLWWVIGYHQFVRMVTPPDDATTVYVTAKQWMWKFTYSDGRSANDTLTVPVGRPTKLAMTSRDVIHSFYVPGFRIKQDVLPGVYVTTWFEATTPGVYPIYCAEYCGIAHSRMLGQVVVLSAEDYQKWLRDVGRDASGKSALAPLGAQIAEKRECLACHTINGQPHIGPTWARLYGSWVTLEGGRRVMADEEYLTRSMMEPQADIVAGFKPVMPTYQATLPDAEVAALVEYIRSLRDAPISAGVTLPSLTVTAFDAGAPDSPFALPPAQQNPPQEKRK